MSTPGLTLPTVQSMAAGNHRDSAIASNSAMSHKQNLANQMSAGSKRRRRRRSGSGRSRRRSGSSRRRSGSSRRRSSSSRRRSGSRGGAVVIPQFTMSYKPTGGVGQDPNALIAKNSQSGVQSAENSKYDQNAMIHGGRRHRQCRCLRCTRR